MVFEGSADELLRLLVLGMERAGVLSMSGSRSGFTSRSQPMHWVIDLSWSILMLSHGSLSTCFVAHRQLAYVAQAELLERIAFG